MVLSLGAYLYGLRCGEGSALPLLKLSMLSFRLEELFAIL
jgi:hypothetical protein